VCPEGYFVQKRAFLRANSSLHKIIANTRESQYTIYYYELLNTEMSVGLNAFGVVCVKQIRGSNKLLKARGDKGMRPSGLQRFLLAAAIALIAGSGFGFEPNDQFFSQQWNLEVCNFPEAWEYSIPRRDFDTVTIAIFDHGGLDGSHPDLQGRVAPGYDAIDDDSTPGINNHAQAIAGICAAHTNNSEGIASCGYNVQVMGIRAFSNDVTLWTDFMDALERGFNYCIANNVDIISFSVIFQPPPNSVSTRQLRIRLDNLFENAYNNNICIIAATVWKGWDPDFDSWYPAAHPDVLGVGLINRSLATPGDFADLDVVAPDDRNWSLNTSDGYDTFPGGGSYASPHVTGLAALLIAHYRDNPDISYSNPEVIYNLIRSGARDLGDPGYDLRYGYGLLDARGSLDILMDKFEITSIIYDEISATAEITWNCVPGKEYDVYFSDNFPGNPVWTFADSVISASSTVNWIDDGSLTGSSPISAISRFFRVIRPDYPSF